MKIINLEDNIYYQTNSSYFLELKTLVEKYPTAFSGMLKRTGYKKLNGKIIYNANNDRSKLLNWINTCLPLLIDTKYTLATKCNWIFNNRQSFPICPTCNKDEKFKLKNIGVFGNYQHYCCSKCAENNSIKKQKALNTLYQHYGNNLQEFKNKIKNGWSKHTSNDTKNIIIKRKHTKLLKYNDENFTNREKAKQTTILHYGVDNPFKSNEIQAKIKQIALDNYGVEHFLQAKEIQQKSLETITKKYGVSNVAQSSIVRSKMHKKYLYNNIQFDSGWEICYYEYLIDNNIEFVYHPTKRFIYFSKNKKHYYEPDFYLIDSQQYIEIKGDNHFTNDLPIYNNKFDWTDKYKCILLNNVIILTRSKMEYIFNYITSKHQIHYKKYVQQFKNI